MNIEITFRVAALFFAFLFLVGFLFCIDEMRNSKTAASARRFFFPLALSIFSLFVVSVADVWLVFVARVAFGTSTAFFSVSDGAIFFSAFQVAFTTLALVNERPWQEDICRKMRLGSLACSLLTIGCFTHHIFSAL
jgi:hypothetical protein